MKWQEMTPAARLDALQAALTLLDTMERYAWRVAEGERPEGPPSLWAWPGEPPQDWTWCLCGDTARRVRALAADLFQDADTLPPGEVARPLALADFEDVQDRFRAAMRAGMADPMPETARRLALDAVRVCSRAFGLAEAEALAVGDAAGGGDVAALAAELLREVRGAKAAAERAEAEGKGAKEAAETQGAETRAAVDEGFKRLEGRKRGLDGEEKLVLAFKQMEVELPAETAESGGSDEAANQSNAVERVRVALQGRGIVLTVGTKDFLKKWRAWRGMGMPKTGEAYAKAKATAKAAKRKAGKAG